MCVASEYYYLAYNDRSKQVAAIEAIHSFPKNPGVHIHSILFHPLFNKHHTTQHSLNASHHTAFYFDSDTQMLPAIITTTTTDRSIAFLFPVISLYSVIPQMLDTIVGPQQMIGNEIVSPVYAFA